MSIKRQCTVGRLLAGVVTAAVLAAIASCSEDVGRESTDGNTSFLSPCETNEHCPSTLECLCGVCSRTCTSDEECSAFRSSTCARPVVVGLECPLRGSLCFSRSAGVPEAGAGGSGGAAGVGGSPATGGRASGGTTSGGAGALVDAGGARNTGGVLGNGGSETDGAADGGECLSIDVPDAGSPCSLAICSDGADYQIRVTRDLGWYVGALWWNLVLCNDISYPEAHPAGSANTIAFRATATEFAAMDKNARVYVYYGEPSGPSPAGPAANCGTLNDRLTLPQPTGECVD
jgi:hypothetical protein